MTCVAPKIRVEYEGGIYHLINRGDRRQPIFKGDPDRKLFIETLAETEGRWGESGNSPPIASGDRNDGVVDQSATPSGQPELCKPPPVEIR